MEMDIGTGLRFWGNQCRHYTDPNRTDSTRVSFDFRVVPRQLWRGDTCGLGKIGDYKTSVVDGPVALLPELVQQQPQGKCCGGQTAGAAAAVI